MTHLFAAILTNTTSGRCPLRKMPSLLSPVYYQSSVEPSNVDFCMGFQRCSSSIVFAGEHLGRKVCNAAPRQISEKEYVEEVFPITEWYTSRLPTDPQEQRRRIRPSWFEKREGYKDFTKPMPPGWKRVPVPENEPRLYPDGCSKYLFGHESMLEPYGRLSEWYYPFPVSEIQESTAPFMPEQTPYLFCETVQARLSGYQQDSDKLQYPWDNKSKLCDRLGKDIGKLHLPNKETRDRFPENANGAEIGLPVDIVAVCRLKRCSKTLDREHRETRLPIFKEDLYLVLWVEWKDGIAY
ncbi:hypothetical protein FOPG_14614 [Fusarium oxysporum f. sp. conglutinans race 2 54008]|uniref:Uncharacterized protein n=1 Tax=Fusarium oxysporum f. sp. conglutinans race 2 54008 TaxID=1089457 RepID=X0I834_FUSOX|nr:hypothetical protein FOPG_14614 [Fusarium oxysporum f. sp. conglutinans race 2 54008]